MTDRTRLLRHPVLAGGARRAAVLAAIAFVILDAMLLAAAIWPAAMSGRCTLGVTAGVAIAIAAIVDLVAHRSFRRAWSDAVTKPWRVRRCSTLGRHHRTRLEHASRPWGWLVVGAQMSLGAGGLLVLVLDTMSVFPLVLPILITTNMLVNWTRSRRGTVDADLSFETGRVGTGGTFEVVARITPSGAELRPEETSMELRCVRALRPVLGIVPRTRTLAYVAARSFEHRLPPRSTIKATAVFDLPADLPEADLAAAVPTWWELHVESCGPKSAYRDVFLVPVVGLRAGILTAVRESATS